MMLMMLVQEDELSEGHIGSHDVWQAGQPLCAYVRPR